MFSPLARLTGSWSRYRTATYWTRRVPSSVPPSPYTVLTFAPSTGFCLRYRTATHWTRRVPSSVPPSPCTRPLLTVQVPGQDTGQLPTRRGGFHLLCRNHYVLTFGHCTGSWSRYPTATHWMRRVPSSVPQSPCTHPLLTGRCVIAASLLKLTYFVFPT
jgi:hypothetical protein